MPGKGGLLWLPGLCALGGKIKASSRASGTQGPRSPLSTHVRVFAQAGPLARSPGQGAPRSPSDEALGARTFRAEQVPCRAPLLLDTGLFLFLLPF